VKGAIRLSSDHSAGLRIRGPKRIPIPQFLLSSILCNTKLRNSMSSLLLQLVTSLSVSLGRYHLAGPQHDLYTSSSQTLGAGAHLCLCRRILRLCYALLASRLSKFSHICNLPLAESFPILTDFFPWCLQNDTPPPTFLLLVLLRNAHSDSLAHQRQLST
jgi:hypothetical protein